MGFLKPAWPVGPKKRLRLIKNIWHELLKVGGQSFQNRLFQVRIYSFEGPSIKDVGIFQGGGGSQIPMLQEIRRQKLGKSGSKFRHGGGGDQKRPKKFRRLLWTAPYPDDIRILSHAVQKSVFLSVLGQIYLFICLLVCIPMLHNLDTLANDVGMQIVGTYLLCRWVPTGLKSGLSGNLKDVSSFKLQLQGSFNYNTFSLFIHEYNALSSSDSSISSKGSFNNYVDKKRGRGSVESPRLVM